MKKRKKLWLLLSLTVLIVSGSVVGVASAADPIPETLFIEPSPGVLREPFYGVSPELKSELEQIVMADSRVQGIIESKDNIFIIDGQTIEDRDFDIIVGVRLIDEITPEQFREWVKCGRHDSNLIKEYIGVMRVGYNDRYHIEIDKDKQEVREIVQETGYRNIPEVTTEEKRRAIEIALSDASVLELLKNKDYQIAPDGKTGVWHNGQKKLGVVFTISFEKPYPIDAELPVYKAEEATYHFTGIASSLVIHVLIDEDKVGKISALASTGEN